MFSLLNFYFYPHKSGYSLLNSGVRTNCLLSSQCTLSSKYVCGLGWVRFTNGIYKNYLSLSKWLVGKNIRTSWICTNLLWIKISVLFSVRNRFEKSSGKFDCWKIVQIHAVLMSLPLESCCFSICVEKISIE